MEAAVTIGDGTPLLDANGVLITPALFGGSGAARVSNGGVLHSLGNLDVGRRGTAGTLLVDPGGRASADAELVVGTGTDHPDGTGTVTVQAGCGRMGCMRWDFRGPCWLMMGGRAGP